VRNFATSPNIQIMVARLGPSTRRDVNNLYSKDSEKTGGEKPIDLLIRAARPIIIVPMNRKCGWRTLERARARRRWIRWVRFAPRYSATHADKHHMVYRLDAADKCKERKLVKQIE
jgi:type III restriction enzyme